MTSHDVRSILNLPGTSQNPHPSTSSRRPVTARKPDGISRELYALIGDNAPSLAEAQASLAALKYRHRPVKGKKVKWEWTQFMPRKSLRLSHWTRSDATTIEQRKFDSPSVMEYSQFEYDLQLADAEWTPHETAYLFDLLRQYDLRFVVAADRYEYPTPSGTKRRTIEDMKDRYYTICRRLVRSRTATDPQQQQQMLQAYAFDKVREIKRKQYASELFHLTTAEIAEEEALYIEIKRMEQNERRYRTDRDELMRTIIGLDSGLISLDQVNGEGVIGMNKKRKRDDEPPIKKPESSALDAAHCIYRTSTNPTTRLQHIPVYLRSSKMPAPKPTAAIRIKELLTEMGVAQRLVMPTRENNEVYDRLLIAAGGLVDMKRQVDRVEQEVRTLKAQKDGFVAPRKSRSASITSTGTGSSTLRKNA